MSMILIPSTGVGTIANPWVTNLAELVQTTFCLVDLLDPILGLGITPLEGILERLKPGVNAQDTCILCISFWRQIGR